MLKAEKREKLTRNRRKMVVSGRGIFNLIRVRNERVLQERTAIHIRNERIRGKRVKIRIAG